VLHAILYDTETLGAVKHAEHAKLAQKTRHASLVVQALGPARVRLALRVSGERRLAMIMREMSTVSMYAVRVSSLVPHTGFSSRIGTYTCSTGTLTSCSFVLCRRR
jgi:hypothetical protein